MARIAVVGSVAQDDVVTLLQPLSAGCHLDAAARKLRLGGGGANTAIPLGHAGHDVVLVAPVGADAVAEWLLAKLQAAGIDVSAVSRMPGDSTRSIVLVDPGGERTIVNLGVGYQFSPKFGVNLDVSNLTNEPISQYRGIPDQMERTLIHGTTINIGVSGRF